MGITRIKIRNYKQIKKLELDISNNINCLVGKNGVGKSTINNALLYFYEMAQDPYAMKPIIDKKNPYLQKCSIELTFSFKSFFEDRDINEFLIQDLQVFAPYIKDGQFIIKYTQFKNGEYEWYPVNDRYKVKKILRYFPVYLVQTRNIDGKSWSKLWDMISDIAVTGIKADENEVKNTMREAFEKAYGSKFNKTMGIMEDIFSKENISINDEELKKRFKHALMTNLGGEMFMYDDEDVEYYSDGIKALEYLRILLGFLSELSELAWKDILILLDEPETYLHLQYVEELAETISKAALKVKFIVATHSTRLISSILKGSDENSRAKFNQVCIENGYTSIRPLQDIVKDKDKYLIRDNEAESYFANAIIFVEGQTEIQVLKNRNIVKLFPKLGRLTVYNTQSNDSATKLILPNRYKPGIPFLVLLDMDKIIEYIPKKKKYDIKDGNKEMNPLANERIQANERYYYPCPKRESVVAYKKKIDYWLSQEFEIDNTSKYGDFDGRFSNLAFYIKKYCREYRTIVVETTIEGTVICTSSISFFWEWLRFKWGEEKYTTFANKIETFDLKTQVMITRAIFHGKTDYLFKCKQEVLPKIIFDTISMYKSGDKVDGWIFDFFEWYFDTHIRNDIPNGRMKFKRNFPELYELVEEIENMI